PTGEYVESAWDIVSLGLGCASLAHDLSQDKIDWVDVGMDIFGVGVDTVALALPLVPGGVGAAIKSYRAGKEALQVGTKAYNLERGLRAAQIINAGLNIGRGASASNRAFSEGSYGWGTFYLGMTALGIRGVPGKVHAFRLPNQGLPNAIFTLQ